MAVVIETDRLVLRHLVPGDLDDLARLYADEEVRRHFPDRTRTRAQTREELDWFIQVAYARDGYGLWATVLRQTEAVIGRCGLLSWEIEGRREVEVAYLLDPAVWGQGLATEAASAIVAHGLATLDVDRLICLIDPGNEPSRRVAQKIGMSLVDPHYVDEEGPAHLYAITRDRWAG